MSTQLLEKLSKIAPNETIISTELLTSLWEDYGSIKKIKLSNNQTFIVKEIAPPKTEQVHENHDAKIKSYLMEENFYKNFSKFCENDFCKVPEYFGSFIDEDSGCVTLRGGDWMGGIKKFKKKILHAKFFSDRIDFRPKKDHVRQRTSLPLLNPPHHRIPRSPPAQIRNGPQLRRILFHRL